MKWGGAPKGAPLSAKAMSYQLRQNVSFCLVGGHVVFLDIAEDRYFRLSTNLERAFIAHFVEGGEWHPGEIDRLVELNLLVESGSEVNEPTDAAGVETPRRSALEEARPATTVPIATQLLVLSIVGRTQLALKTRPLKDVLLAMTDDRKRRCTDRDNEPVMYEAQLHEATASFNRARLNLPLETCCLLDSLSFLRYLAARRLFARLVLGVTGEPFSAHCWVQAGDLVLNDTVGNANAHTPIRVI